MDAQPHKTKLKDRVRIKDSVTQMYPMARAYMEGTVRKQMHDELGYPLIFVQWDQNHWAYSGEPDRWALEAHFDTVEGKVEEKDDKLIEALMQVLENHRKGNKEESQNVQDPLLRNDREPDPDDYYSVLTRAMDDASDGEAFVVIVARRDHMGEAEIIVPHMYAASKPNAEDAMLLLEAAMSDAGAQHHGRMVYEEIKRLRGDDGKAGS